jgi:glycyl-tRNA synthetase alpha chain
MTYGDVRLADELQFSVYNFEAANVDSLWKHMELYEAECQALLDRFAALQKAAWEKRSPDRSDGYGKATSVAEVMRFPLLPAFDLCLKCSHLFNLLDARGAISVTERVGVIARIRNLAVGVAKAWTVQQQSTAKESVPEPAAAKA